MVNPETIYRLPPHPNTWEFDMRKNKYLVRSYVKSYEMSLVVSDAWSGNWLLPALVAACVVILRGADSATITRRQQ